MVLLQTAICDLTRNHPIFTLQRFGHMRGYEGLKDWDDNLIAINNPVRLGKTPVPDFTLIFGGQL